MRFMSQNTPEALNPCGATIEPEISITFFVIQNRARLHSFTNDIFEPQSRIPNSQSGLAIQMIFQEVQLIKQTNSL
jgi:hypothetical protein